MDREQWIEIARTGTFTDSAGRQRTFTAEDLDAIAAGYDPAKRDAPLTFGHPQNDRAPAFGWVDRLKSEGGKLYASLVHVPEQVHALVDAGHYRHVSMSLMPDLVTLRHVALLGAAQPAIDGLRAVEFVAGGDAVTVDFAVARSESEAATALAASDSESRTRRAGERHPEKREGEDTMTIEELQRQIGQLQGQLEALRAENADLKKKADARKQEKDTAEAARTEAERKAQKAGADFAAYREKIKGERREARVAELVKAGKVKPAEKAGILEFAAKLAERTDSVNFSAPNGGTESLSLEERYFRDLEARPADARGAEFSAPPAHAGGMDNDFNPAELTARL